MSVCIHLNVKYVYVCMYVCISMYVCMYVCMLCLYVWYVCMYVMFVCVICMHVCTCYGGFLQEWRGCGRYQARHDCAVPRLCQDHMYWMKEKKNTTMCVTFYENTPAFPLKYQKYPSYYYYFSISSLHKLLFLPSFFFFFVCADIFFGEKMSGVIRPSPIAALGISFSRILPSPPKKH